MRRLAPAALLLLAACATRRPADSGAWEPEYQRIGALEMSAVLEQDAADLMGSVDIMNTGDRAVLVEYQGSCAVSILLGRAGTSRRWDALEFWRRYPDVCRPEPTRLEIPPGTLARILTPPVTQTQVLGDSLPPGRYDAALRLRMLQPRDTTLILRAGPVRLGPSGGVQLGP